MMYPEYFPSCRKEPSEEYVFQHLKKLSHQYDIFYHKKIAEYHRLPCEIDFVIFDRNKSVLLLEVKGGHITYKGGAWKSWQNEIDPEKQAEDNKTRFMNYYGLKDKMLVDFCLVFPDTDVEVYPESLLEYQVISKIHFQNLEAAIRHAFKCSRESLGNALPYVPTVIDTRFYNQLLKAVEGEVKFHIPLSRKVELEGKKMRELSEEQYTIYECCMENNRILVNGVAGSGKTILAQKIAREYYSQGANVLLLCYNIMLGQTFQKEQQRITAVSKSKNNITATACHTFLQSVISDKTLYDQINHSKSSSEKEEFYELNLPAQIEEEMNKERIPTGTCDVLIIDEAQDFNESILEQLCRLVNENGKIILLRDEKQTLYRQNFIPKIESFFKLRLNKNLRNTKSIIKFINQVLDMNLLINPDSPEGEPVEHAKHKDNRTQLQQLSVQIASLLKHESLTTDNILILYPEKINEHHCLHGITQINNIPLKELPDNLLREKNTLYFTRIRKFKGLETEVLLIPNFELFKDETFDTNYVYTALTRAKNRLFVYEKSRL